MRPDEAGHLCPVYGVRSVAAAAAAGCARAALEFDEFYRPEEVRSIPGFQYDAGVVAMKGALGLELATALRERSAALPLLWLSDDEKFGLAAFDLGAAMLLPLNCTDRELADGLRRCGVKERWEAMG